MAGLSEPPGDEPHARGGLAGRLNRLRAGVLGANDGIVSVAALTVGVAGATSSTRAILTAGLAALVGGAISMALGEYVSVSSQRDTERALIAQEQAELQADPVQELTELTDLYRARGLSSETARKVAEELTQHDVLGAHLEAELGIDATDVVSPWHAAGASGLAFTIGGLLPLLTVVLIPAPGQDSVDLRDRAVRPRAHRRCRRPPRWQPRRPASLRVVVGGALALATTFGIGSLLGAPAG